MKRQNKIAIAVGAAALVGVAAVATASQAHRYHHGEYGYGHKGKMKMAMQMMEKVDKDGDRVITRDEIDQFREEKVLAFDVDQDGAIALEEFEGMWVDFMRDRMVDRFQHLDRDGDGLISEAEMDERVDRVVRRLDRNEDGVIDQNDRRRHKHDHDEDDN